MSVIRLRAAVIVVPDSKAAAVVAKSRYSLEGKGIGVGRDDLSRPL
ncbi:hypothetical protein [Methylobacterium gnaphalii]|uniref:Uncharacterized protein n=1 Tax=Methylobacterium gnaphalii TaxID=1010610 RepID=A0A512JP56_9HYPH|nr:hypothetical protein [Methylobacterium gnaphalii]GEP11737.1 hypothetical protein MGN01_35820 [Methylobacterium gnaphalii]GLS50234.1 hypothetical protein GCM10007885_30860 [Methylobacterium gnaphalii]